MNVGGLIKYLLRRSGRRMVTRGINTGIDKAMGGGSDDPGQTAAKKRRARRMKKNVASARRALRLFRRFR